MTNQMISVKDIRVKVTYQAASQKERETHWLSAMPGNSLSLIHKLDVFLRELRDRISNDPDFGYLTELSASAYIYDVPSVKMGAEQDERQKRARSSEMRVFSPRQLATMLDLDPLLTKYETEAPKIAAELFEELRRAFSLWQIHPTSPNTNVFPLLSEPPSELELSQAEWIEVSRKVEPLIYLRMMRSVGESRGQTAMSLPKTIRLSYKDYASFIEVTPGIIRQWAKDIKHDYNTDLVGDWYQALLPEPYSMVSHWNYLDKVAKWYSDNADKLGYGGKRIMVADELFDSSSARQIGDELSESVAAELAPQMKLPYVVSFSDGAVDYRLSALNHSSQEVN